MKPVSRWLINGMTLMLSMLCVTTWVLHALHFSDDDIFTIRSTILRCDLRVMSHDGGLGCVWANIDHKSLGRWRGLPPDRQYTTNYFWGRSHFGIIFNTPAESQLMVPMGQLMVRSRVVFLVTALPPIVWLLWKLLRRRPKSGHCHKCSYDLTGNVSGVCPECGRPVRPVPLPTHA
jgi:hypothetical protein